MNLEFQEIDSGPQTALVHNETDQNKKLNN